MLREHLTPISEQEANIFSDEKIVSPEVNLQDTSQVMTELMRALVHHDFKSMDANPVRWAMQGNLVKTGQQNPHKIQVFLNIRGASNVFIQVEIVRIPENPIILLQGNFPAKAALEMIRNLPYFPRYE